MCRIRIGHVRCIAAVDRDRLPLFRLVDSDDDDDDDRFFRLIGSLIGFTADPFVVVCFAIEFIDLAPFFECNLCSSYAPPRRR